MAATKKGTKTLSNPINGRVLSVSDLLAAGRSALRFVEIPELQGGVYLRQMTAGDVMAFAERAQSKDEGDRENVVLETIAKSVVNEDGVRLFADDDIQKLRDMPISIFNKLSGAINEMTGIRAKEEEGKG